MELTSAVICSCLALKPHFPTRPEPPAVYHNPLRRVSSSREGWRVSWGERLCKSLLYIELCAFVLQFGFTSQLIIDDWFPARRDRRYLWNRPWAELSNYYLRSWNWVCFSWIVTRGPCVFVSGRWSLVARSSLVAREPRWVQGWGEIGFVFHESWPVTRAPGWAFGREIGFAFQFIIFVEP